MRIRFGIEIPHRSELLGPVAIRAEALGFDSVWIGDHVAIHRPTLDSLAALSYIPALTHRVRIGPCVYLLALRHPTIAAKLVASLDVLPGGRVVFGVGVGGEFPKEFEAAGVRTFVVYFTVPGERVPEQLERFGTEVLPRVAGWARPGAPPRVA